MACSGFLVSVETSTTPHYLCADQPTDTILHIKQELQKRIGIPDSQMIFIDKNEKVWRNHEIITANLDLKLMTTPSRPYTETQLDNVTDLLVGSKLGQEYQTEMLDFYLPKLFELTRTQQEEVIKISSENMEKEWNASFEPVVNRLKKDLKRRVQQLVTDKVMLEQEIQRQQSGACAEFDFEKEFEKTYISSVFRQRTKSSDNFVSGFVKAEYNRPLSGLKELLSGVVSILQKRERVLTFFVCYDIEMVTNSPPNYYYKIYIITLSHIYEIGLTHGWNTWVNPQNAAKLLYKFDIDLSPSFCKIFVNYCSLAIKGGAKIEDHFTLSFKNLFTSIPGTLYPLTPYWKWLDTPDESLRYIHERTGEIVDQIPYGTVGGDELHPSIAPPVKYD